jgi:Arc/MetJ-type ribon-helix-helix transcriptional regulator
MRSQINIRLDPGLIEKANEIVNNNPDKFPTLSQFIRTAIFQLYMREKDNKPIKKELEVCFLCSNLLEKNAILYNDKKICKGCYLSLTEEQKQILEK